MRWPLPTRVSRQQRARRFARPRLVEGLEHRVLLAGDILVVNEVPGVANDYHLTSFTQSGALNYSVSIPKGSGATDSPVGRGVTVDQNGNIDVWNGTFAPVLSSFSPTTKAWLPDQTMAGWSTVNNVSYGGLAAYKNYVFATDMSTAGAGAPQGIIRFDMTGATAPVRFGTDVEFTKVVVGQDGMLYGLGGLYPSEVTVYDLNTLAQVRSITLKNAPDTDIRGMAVDAAGEIFTATWGGYIAKYDSTGNFLSDLHPGGNQSDMALDTDGQIVTTDSDSKVYLTDTALDPITSFTTGQWFGFVAFDHFINVTASQPPTANAGGPYSVTEGGTVQLDGSKSSDPNANPRPLTDLWDLNGNGVFGETGAAATRGNETGATPTYNAAGLPGGSTQTVRLKVFNSEGQSTTTSTTIAIVNQAPTVSLPSATAINAGGTFSGQGAFSDPGGGETYTATVDYGDGSGTQSLALNANKTFALSHPYTTAGKFTVTVKVSDGTDVGTGSVAVTVNAAGVSFDSLAGASITYGQPTVMLDGHIAGAPGIPGGSVNITLAGVTQSASIDPTTGNFSAVFDTSMLGVAGSPYTVTYNYPGDSSHGSVTDTSQAVKVAPRTLVVTPVDETKTYGDADPSFGVSYSGFAGSENASVLSGTLVFATNEPSGNAPVGNYTITPSGLSSPNYTIVFQTGTLSVTPRPLSAWPNGASKIYGDPDPLFGASFLGLAPGDNSTVLGGPPVFSTTEPSGNAPVGNYTIALSGLSSPNYTITYHTGTLTVTPRPLTITADSASKTYGDPDPAFSASYSGFAPGEDAGALAGTLTFQTNEPAGNAPVAAYAITPGGVGSSNYTISFVPGTLTVTTRSLTITANNATKTYGDPDPAFTVSYNGFAAGDGPGNLGGTLAFATDEPSGNAPVGNDTITPTGLTSANYSIAFKPGTLSVTPRALIITANDASKSYGDADPAFGASFSGFATGDGPSQLNGALAFATNEPSGNAPVGKYAVTPSGLTSGNYSITFVPGTLTVAPRALTVAANNASKVYGAADPAFTVSYNGFATGDGPSVLTGTLTVATNEPSGNAPVGKYTITPGGLTSGNYSITFVPGTLTVAPRALTVAANNASKIYGDADPAFTVSYNGFATGDGPSVLGGTLAFATSEPSGNAPVGQYTITASGLSSPNYAIAFVPGTLSVTRRALTVTANDVSKTYGQADPVFTASATGFAPGDSLTNLGGTLAFATSETDPLTAPVGTYTIAPSGLSSSNYAITFSPGTLTVARAVTSFAGLPSPTVPVGSPTVSLSARIQSNSVLPVGQTVTVTILGSRGALASGSGAIQRDGTFTAVVNTSGLPIGSYTVAYSYAGDHNFTAATANGTLSVGIVHTVKPLYDTDRAHESGSTIPIKIEVDDAAGKNVSSPDLVITAVAIVDSKGNRIAARARGAASADNIFKNVGHGYQYNLDTSGLAPGRYSLLVSVGNDPALQAVTFVID